MEVDMKQWLKENFFTRIDVLTEPSIMSEKDFYIEISMIALALAFFGVVLHVVG